MYGFALNVEWERICLRKFSYMDRLPSEITHFFQNQSLVIVSTIDKNGSVHNSCKGIVKINKDGKIYLLDLYQEKTFENLNRNPNISITAVNEHSFKGYCLKGKAKIMPSEKLTKDILKAWEDRIASRITQRVIKNIREEKGHPRHPEALLPRPKYLIMAEIEDIVDLTPHRLK